MLSSTQPFCRWTVAGGVCWSAGVVTSWGLGCVGVFQVVVASAQAQSM